MDGIWAFLAMTVLLSVSPGPDDVLVLRSALRGGPRTGLATVGGVAVGTLAWGTAAAFGVAAVVTGSDSTVEALRLGGAGYLVLLGVVPLVAEARGRAQALLPVGAAAPPAPTGLGRSFSAGLLSDLLNPKIGLFYLAVVPQFVREGAPVLQYSLLLCAIDVGVAVVWLSTLAWLASAAADWLMRPVVVLWSQRSFSVVLVVLGATTALGA
ncbi:LysE family translocator [Blastococcus haudaquaticus]|uniref:Threonine/homoserine/homoserine lactone efflux protein n=1 Tax=Blastococcus haudaquaticus TaxID=1938745 RepID=A0A286GQL7_9ACTN|nr:LysE family translocator [Blastococcus haudaquaticus]SOD97823.1 Threonine/homoserine/homoserine lactone efflux protein [Blastococcus haudaquaticus]